jgi:hypothetical protein
MRGTRSCGLIGATVMAALCLLASPPAARAQAQDVAFGDVKLMLLAPEGQCLLDASQPTDKQRLEFAAAPLAQAKIDLLAMAGECNELAQERTGRRNTLDTFSQYQTQAPSRSSAYRVADAKSTCAAVRAQGAQKASDVVASVNDALRQASNNIRVQGQTFLGVLGDDPNGCYVGLYLKYQSDGGGSVEKLNVFFHGSIKDRQLNVYFYVPYTADMKVEPLLATVQAHLAKLKAANGS